MRKTRHSPGAGAQRTTIIWAPVPAVLYDLYGWGDVVFEEFCCHLLYYEPEIKNPDLYNRPRQKQFGADAVADRRDKSGIDAISCKCYKTLGKGKITEFCDEFLDHWATHWAQQNVRRFVLCVPNDLRSAERRLEIAAEKNRFAALGVEFEAWGQRHLSHRLHANPTLVRIYYRPYEEQVPPVVQPTLSDGKAPATASFIDSATLAQLSALQTALESDVRVQLDQFQELLRRGLHNEADAELLKIRNDQTRWTSLTAPVKARLLRMRALVSLKSGNTDLCEQLLKEADALSPADEPRVRALLALRSSGWNAALKMIETPSTKDGALLKAGLLIEAGRTPDAKHLLAEWNALKGHDAEWHRLSAYVHCLDGHLTAAIEDIKTAETLAPDWISVIETGAVVRYAAALSPAARFHGGALPVPVPFALVRQDDASQQGLRQAFSGFETLAASERDTIWRQRFLVWKFACLALLVGREADAEHACLALIKQKPFSEVAVFWALERGYAFDVKKTIQNLERNLRGTKPSFDDLQALVACAVADSDIKKAVAAIKRHGKRFEDPESQAAANTLRERMQARRAGKLPAEVATDSFQRLEPLLRVALATNEWNLVAAFLKTIPESPELILMACSAAAGKKQWSIIAEHGERLLTHIATGEAARLIAYAYYETRKYDRATQVLDDHVQLFPGARLPYELQRLKAYAAARRGDLHLALPIAQELAQRSGDTADHVLLIDLLIQAGAVAKAVPFLRELLPKRKWTAEELLRWVPSVSNEEPELAGTLIRMATALDPTFLHGVSMIDWSFRLGLDREANALLGRLTANGDPQGMRRASLEEVLQYMRARHLTNEEMGKRYLHGDAPIHLLAGPAATNLAILWNACFTGRIDARPLLIRSGNRSTDFFPGPVITAVNLHLDITALLTIDQLGLLNVLDGSDFSVTLPHTLLPLLQMLERDARPHQPSRIKLLEAVLASLRNGDARLVSSGTVLGADAICVVHAAAAGETAALARTTDNRQSVGLGAIADELVRRGGLLSDHLEIIRSTYGGWASVVIEADLSSVQNLIFDGTTIDMVIDAGLLENFRSHFALWVQADHHSQCVAELERLQANNAVADGLRTLRNRLSTGVTEGTYRVLPQPDERADDSPSLLKDHPLSAPLRELLELPTADRAWLWIDDRHCTAYAFANGNPIVSSFEVLDALRAKQQIEAATYYALLDKMRQAQAQILPVRFEEVMYQLRRTTLDEDVLIESPPLKNLRVSFNRLLNLENYLDLKSIRPADAPFPEQHCLIHAFRVARKCLEALWSDDALSDDQLTATSRWVWDALHIDRFSRLPATTEPLDLTGTWRLSVALHVLVALSLSPKASASRPSCRARYLRWLSEQWVDLTKYGDPQTLEDAAIYVGKLLLEATLPSLETAAGSEVPPEQLRLYLGLFITELPEALRLRLYAIPALMSALKPDLQTVLNIGNEQFEAQAFWRSAAKAVAGETSSVSALSKKTFLIKAQGAEFELSGDQTLRFLHPDLPLLSPNAEERSAHLRAQRWLADSASEHAQAAERIAALADPSQRMEALHTWEEQAPAGRYVRLGKILEPTPRLTLEALRPATAQQYVDYLGLKLLDDGSIDWQQSVTTLIERFSVEELIERWAGLPVVLPPAVLDAVKQGDPAIHAALFDDARSEHLSVCRRLKLLEVLTRVGPNDTLSDQLVDGILSLWNEQAEAFVVALRWSERAWRRDDTWYLLPVAARLACVWCHAERILSLLLKAGFSTQLLIERFPAFHPNNIRYALPLEQAYDDDIAAPGRINPTIFLMLSFNAIFGAERPPTIAAREVAFRAVIIQSPIEGFPGSDVFEDRRGGANALGTYLAVELHDWLAQFVGFQEVRLLTALGQDWFLAELLKKLEARPEDVSLWATLHAVGYQWLSADSLSRIEAVLEVVKFPDGSTSAESFVLWTAIAGIRPYINEDLRAVLTKRLIAWTHHLSTIHAAPVVYTSDDTAAGADAGLIMEFTLLLSRRESLKASLDALAAIAGPLIAAWPALAGEWRQFLGLVLRASPFTAGEGLWRSFVRIRGLP